MAAPPFPSRLVDCHHHVYEAGRPTIPNTRASLDAPLRHYRAVAARVGVTHQILVQPSSYGFDNALHLAARAAVGEAARVVAVLPPDADAATCRALRDGGVVGLRANLHARAPTGPGDVAGLGRLCAGNGWHLQVLAEAGMIVALGDVLRGLPCPLVLDHYAFLPPAGFAAHPAWGIVAGLLGGGRAWVKLSSPYGVPDGAGGDFQELTQALVAANPGAVVWGSNWPHPNAPAADGPPDEAALLRDALAPLTAAEAAAVRWANPARLYGFSAAPGVDDTGAAPGADGPGP